MDNTIQRADEGFHINAGDLEHLGVMAAGTALVTVGLAKRKSYVGWGLTVLGAAMLVRGAQGYKRIYRVLGKDPKPVQMARRALIVEDTIVIDRSAKELYNFWRDLENLPKVMGHILSVQQISDSRSHWVAKAPAGMVVEWDADIIRDEPKKIIAWQSLEGSDVDNAGSVQFEDNPGGGTRVTIKIRYNPPADLLGAKIAQLFGADPAKEVAEDLRRFKQMVEAKAVM